ncbi:hypothetical protein [Segetibacter aerophilus]|uniref:hypothetical protein n=1 Tax=Segetibacter aerophilus TaxID=670293 RepID=UPI0011BF0167|nr:hypothetical protein [Segetibacter aerophilus]
MKFDDQLAAFLYENKTLRLEGIGTFTLDSKVSVPSELEKEIYYPIEGLSFTYNPKCETDEDVITYLVRKLHKIQPLIRSDLESYLSNIRQFINLGKPYTIEGVGTLSKNNQGTFEFTPGNFLPVKEELNPKRENADHNYPVRSQSNAGRVVAVILIVIAALAALGGIGWGVSNLLSKRQVSNNNEQQQGSIDTIPQTGIDTSTPITTAISSSNTPTASGINNATSATDSANYKMIFEITTSKERAHRRTVQLHSYNHNSKYDTTHIGDVVRYRLFLPVRIRPSDSTRVKDSLSIFLGSRVMIEKQ